MRADFEVCSTGDIGAEIIGLEDFFTAHHCRIDLNHWVVIVKRVDISLPLLSERQWEVMLAALTVIQSIPRLLVGFLDCLLCVCNGQMTLRRQKLMVGLSGLTSCPELDAVLALRDDLGEGLRVRAQVGRVRLVTTH